MVNMLHIRTEKGPVPVNAAEFGRETLLQPCADGSHVVVEGTAKTHEIIQAAVDAHGGVTVQEAQA